MRTAICRFAANHKLSSKFFRVITASTKHSDHHSHTLLVRMEDAKENFSTQYHRRGDTARC